MIVKFLVSYDTHVVLFLVSVRVSKTLSELSEIGKNCLV